MLIHFEPHRLALPRITVLDGRRRAEIIAQMPVDGAILLAHVHHHHFVVVVVAAVAATAGQPAAAAARRTAAGTEAAIVAARTSAPVGLHGPLSHQHAIRRHFEQFHKAHDQYQEHLSRANGVDGGGTGAAHCSPETLARTECEQWFSQRCPIVLNELPLTMRCNPDVLKCGELWRESLGSVCVFVLCRLPRSRWAESPL